MSDEGLRKQERLAAQGDPAERLRLVYERARCGKLLFSPETYQQISRWRRHLPPNVVQPNISHYQEPRDGQAAEINQLLLTLLHDDVLAMALYLSPSPINFAIQPLESRQRGYSHLQLTPFHGMRLFRRELLLMADSDEDVDSTDYSLFHTPQGVYYRSNRQGILAANDVRGYNSRGKFNPKRSRTAAEVLASLEEVFSRL